MWREHVLHLPPHTRTYTPGVYESLTRLPLFPVAALSPLISPYFSTLPPAASPVRAQNLVHAGKVKVQEEFAQREKDLSIMERVQRSTAVSSARVSKMQVSACRPAVCA